MPKPSTNGSGDAYQIWNNDHAAAAAASRIPTFPLGSRPPRSASATSCCKSGDVGPCALVDMALPEKKGETRVSPLFLLRSAVCRLLQPALFPVVLQRTIVQRRRQPILDHRLRRQHGERGVQLLEL